MTRPISLEPGQSQASDTTGTPSSQLPMLSLSSLLITLLLYSSSTLCFAISTHDDSFLFPLLYTSAATFAYFTSFDPGSHLDSNTAQRNYPQRHPSPASFSLSARFS